MGAVMMEGVDMDEDVTLAGETAQGAFIDETMMVDTDGDADLAWSAEEYAIDVAPDRRHWVAWAALVVMLCAVTAASVWLAAVFYQQQWDRPGKTTAETPKTPLPASPPSEISAPKPLPAPGPPVQHEEAPQAPPAAPPDPDQQFLAEVALIPGTSITNGRLLITSSKVVCTELRNGVSAESEIEGTMRNTGMSRSAAEQLFDAGTTIYCPDMAHR